jgi:DNA-nicking Smr family endonuclease
VHGLKKNEAIACVERRLRELQLAGERKLRVIVGKGNHSKHGVAVLKPAVLNAMQK